MSTQTPVPAPGPVTPGHPAPPTLPALSLFAHSHRRAPVVCIALTALVLLTALTGYHRFFATLDTLKPRWDPPQGFNQTEFDYAWNAARHQATLASGGISIEALGRDWQCWRLLTVNLSNRECQFFYANQPMPWMIAIFVLVFIWLNINIYEMVLGSLRTAGLLLAVGLGSGVVAAFYHAGFAYPGLLPFFPAVSLAFLFGSFRWTEANRQAGEPYFLPLDLLALGVQSFLCYWFQSDFGFVMIPAIAGGVLAGSTYMYAVKPSPRQRAEGVKFNPRQWIALGTLGTVLLLGGIWSLIDSTTHIGAPALRANRLGLAPQDQVVIGYDENGVVHIATAGPGPGNPPPPAANPPAPGTTPPTGPTPAPGPQPPGPTAQPPGPQTVDPARQQAVFDFDLKLARPFYLARQECFTQLKVAGWPSEMKLVLAELNLAQTLQQTVAPIAAFQSDQADLQAYAASLHSEYQAYADWLLKIDQAADDNLVTRAAIKAALRKAVDLTDRRRQQYVALANLYGIRNPSVDLQIGVPLFKPTTVYRRAEEFRSLYDSKIGVVDLEIAKWLDRLEQYRQTPVEMKKWIENKKYIDQLKELLADVEKTTVEDAQIGEYRRLFLDEAQELIKYFDYVCRQAVDNERTTWRDIEDHFSLWLGFQAKRRALEANLLERFNFTNE